MSASNTKFIVAAAAFFFSFYTFRYSFILCYVFFFSSYSSFCVQFYGTRFSFHLWMEPVSFARIHTHAIFFSLFSWQAFHVMTYKVYDFWVFFLTNFLFFFCCCCCSTTKTKLTKNIRKKNKNTHTHRVTHFLLYWAWDSLNE